MARVTKIFGKQLTEAREKKAMTQRELGEAIGCSDETISRVERHEVAGIWTKRLPKLASALGLSLDDFKARFCAAENSPAINEAGRLGMSVGLNMRRARPVRVLPEFQIGIAASRRVDKFSEHPDANRLVAAADRRAFAAPVDGDCQHPKWKHGEIVVFSFDAAEREGILPGKSYYLAFTDGSTTFKRVFKDEKDPDVFVLRCWNRRKYPADQRVHRDEVVRIARAVSKQVVVDEDE
ncbi:MAG TPA: helix-turn-helix domain-containing protein [Tepidisphaeraceae bacterium]|jgi:transcriptional regulator with XRE-family HTH domain|nr:helix-turn-helix domain-containing protein [Tepidisphaeraceae bacterium]